MISLGKAHRIEQAIARISGAFTGELILGETKCNNSEICIMSEQSNGTAAANRLRLDDTGHYHNLNGGMVAADACHELQD